MRPEDYESFRMSIRVLGASYDTFIGEEHTRYYWSVLEDEPFDVVEQLCTQLTRAEHDATAKMPSAHHLRKQVHAERAGGLHELPCQHEGCRGLIPWPSPREDEGRFFCPRHQPDHGRPATVEERKAELVQLTPEGKAFVRPVLKALMANIPITDTERKAGEEQAKVKRARAFEDKAEGPGVNPGVFLNHPFLAADLPSDYRERRQIVTAAGWKFDPSEGRWSRGKRRLTDETIDRFSSLDLLQEYVSRH